MITGDNPLTACHVAKKLKFTDKTTLILQHPNDKGMYMYNVAKLCSWPGDSDIIIDFNTFC